MHPSLAGTWTKHKWPGPKTSFTPHRDSAVALGQRGLQGLQGDRKMFYILPILRPEPLFLLTFKSFISFACAVGCSEGRVTRYLSSYTIIPLIN